MSKKENTIDTETKHVSYACDIPFESLPLLARKMVRGEEAHRRHVMSGFASASILEYSGRVDNTRMFNDLLYQCGMFGHDRRHIESSADIEKTIEGLRRYAKSGRLLIVSDEWRLGRVHYMCDGVSSFFALYDEYLADAVFKDGREAGEPARQAILRHYTYLPSETSVRDMLNTLAGLDGWPAKVEVVGVSYNRDTRKVRIVVHAIGSEGIDVAMDIIKSLDNIDVIEDGKEASI